MLRRDDSVHVIDLNVPKDVFRLPGHGTPVHRVEASDKTQRILTCEWNGSVFLWDLKTITEAIRTRKTAASDGDELVKVVVGRLMTTSITSGNMQVGTIEAAPAFATFSHDGKLFVAALDTAAVWDSVTTAEVTSLRGFKGRLRHAAFSPNNKLVAACGDDGTVHVWDAHSGAERFAFAGHFRTVNRVLFLDNDHLASASSDGTVRVWDVNPDWRLLVDEVLPGSPPPGADPGRTRARVRNPREGDAGQRSHSLTWPREFSRADRTSEPRTIPRNAHTRRNSQSS